MPVFDVHLSANWLVHQKVENFHMLEPHEEVWDPSVSSMDQPTAKRGNPSEMTVLMTQLTYEKDFQSSSVLLT